MYLVCNIFFYGCQGLNPRPCIYYVRSLTTELNSQGHFVYNINKINQLFNKSTKILFIIKIETYVKKKIKIETTLETGTSKVCPVLSSGLLSFFLQGTYRYNFLY